MIFRDTFFLGFEHLHAYVYTSAGAPDQSCYYIIIIIRPDDYRRDESNELRENESCYVHTKKKFPFAQ